MNKAGVAPQVLLSSHDVQAYLASEADDAHIMFFLAERKPEVWASSRSLRHMNALWPSFHYVGVNVTDEDNEEIALIYNLALADKRVAGINHTTPHKSNIVMRERFGVPGGIDGADVLIRNASGGFDIKSCNGPAAVALSRNLIQSAARSNSCSSFADYKIILIGLGGSGRLIAISFAEEDVKELIIVSLSDGEDAGLPYRDIPAPDLRVRLIEELTEGAHPEAFPLEPYLLINASGVRLLAKDFLLAHDSVDSAFIELIEDADMSSSYAELRMPAAYGDDYVIYTNHILAGYIAETCGLPPLSMEEFAKVSVGVVKI